MPFPVKIYQYFFIFDAKKEFYIASSFQSYAMKIIILCRLYIGLDKELLSLIFSVFC